MLRRRGEKDGVMKGRVMRSAAIMAACLAPTLVLPLQGCTIAAYGLGVATMANDSVVRDKEEYASYVRRAETENAERLKAGLPARKILSRRAWSSQSSAP